MPGEILSKGRIIGIYSSIPCQGKSEIRKYLVEKHQFRWLPFAYWLKRMIYSLLVESGYTRNDAIRYIEADKEVPLTKIPGIPTCRFLMQTLGTEWGRNTVHTNLWMGLWESFAGTWSRSGVSVVADDLRFPNEVQVIKSLGGKIWRVERPGYIAPASSTHTSEGRLSSIDFDRVINNDSDIPSLHSKVEKCLRFTRTGVLNV